MPESVRVFLQRGDTELIVILVIAAILLSSIMAIIILFARIGRLEKRLIALTRSASGVNLEETLVQHLNKVVGSLDRIDKLEKSVNSLQVQTISCIQRANLIRFDAFEDVGGELSFAIALLDAQDCGIVISSVHSRQEARIYAKQIQNGESVQALSSEELRVISSGKR